MAADREPRFDATVVALKKRGWRICPTPTCKSLIRNTFCPFCKRQTTQLPLDWGR